MRVTSVGFFIDHILEYLDTASKGEEVIICIDKNKQIRLVLEETKNINPNNNFLTSCQ